MLTFGSLFAGIGGFDLGFERAGMQCRWQVEIDPYCQGVLAKHWPDVGRWDDVRTFPPHPAEDWSVDVICGGDPCQANSAAGKSNQQSFGGEFIAIVDALRPLVVVRENPSLARLDAPWPWWRFRSELERLGYACMPFRLRACCLGAQHRRDRLFLLATDANAYCNRLEGRTRSSPGLESMEPSGLVETYDWPAIPRRIGHNSRAGIPAYVDMVRAAGNSVVPQVAEWIGRRIVDGLVEKVEG